MSVSVTQTQPHTGQLENLIRMVNQIADNLGPAAADDNEAAGLIAGHLQRFWGRNMKEQIVDYVRRDGSALSQIAQSAIRRLGDF